MGGTADAARSVGKDIAMSARAGGALVQRAVVFTTEETAKIFAQGWGKLSDTHTTIIVVVLITFTCGNQLAMIAFDAQNMQLIAKDWLFGTDVRCVPHGAQ